MGGEVTFLRRSEARLKSDLGFAEQRVADLQRDHSALRQQLGGYQATEHEARLMEDVRRTVSAGVGPGGLRVRAPLPGKRLGGLDVSNGVGDATVGQAHQGTLPGLPWEPSDIGPLPM